MKRVIFSFATHNHQPLGNFDHVFEEAYEKSYRPFFELASHFPTVRFATHFTGILLEWLERKHPKYIAMLKQMVLRGQLEIISGGYYEPILSVIPAQDQQAQIARLTKKIGSLFDFQAQGMWLAERVWEQQLASVLHSANIRYVLLDDTHFLHAGLKEADLNGYYLTEDAGNTLAVFPISKALRYTMPFAAVDETIRVLRDAATEKGDVIVTFADDGEKFGVWPQTYEHVYTNGWLEEFFTKLTEHANWIELLPPGESLKRVAPRGRIYLPNASYAEMMQWALPTAEANIFYEDFLHLLHKDEPQWEPYLSFVRGGYWRNFFVKYPESNQLHKHMLRTSARARALAEHGCNTSGAETEILRSQCNDPYWHGVFGGTYLSNLRHANYSALVNADRLLDEAEQRSGVHVDVSDFDCDGNEEVILESRDLSLFIKPSLGGMIAEIDFKPRAFNATNIISRRPEAYHKHIRNAAYEGDADQATSIHESLKAKEPGLEKLLVYDRYRHGCMIEHCLPMDVTIDELRSIRWKENGNFVTSRFDWGWNRENDLLSQSTNAIVAAAPVHFRKTMRIVPSGSELEVTYSMTNESEDAIRFKFASEWAFHLLAGDAPDRYYMSDGHRLQWPAMNSFGTLETNNLRLVDEYLKLAIQLESDARQIARFPIESISMSEGGVERIFQGSIIMALWDVDIAPRTGWNSTLTIRFEEL